MIDLVPSDEQLEVAATAAGVAQRLFARPAADLGAPELGALGDVGLFTLGLAESAGGAGFGVAEEAFVAVELGAALAPVGLLASLVAAGLAADAGRRDLVDAIGAGTARVGWVEPWVWTHDGDVTEWRAVDAAGAGLVVVATPRGAALAEAAAFSLEPIDVRFDKASTLARAERVDTAVVASESAAGLSRARLLVAAAQLGGARRSMELAVEYAKERQQFGVPIGSFQAVKHICADMAVLVDAAHAAVFRAAVSIDAGLGTVDSVNAAKAVAAEAAVRNAESAIQVFGGIGVTAECDAHLYVRRANLLNQMLGAIDFQHEALLRSALDRLGAA